MRCRAAAAAERRQQTTMKKTIISALLAGVLCLGAAAPAHAAEPPAAEQTQSDARQVTIKRMGLLAVEKAVTENNPTVRSLRKTAAGINSGTNLAAQMEMQGAAVEMQIQMYQGLIAQLRAEMEAAGDTESDLYKTYAAQIMLLESQIAGLQQSAATLPVQGAMAVLQMEDAAYQVQRQADGIAAQMTSGAQTMLLSMKNLEYTAERLERQLAALDRSLAVMDTQLSLGMVSKLQVDTTRNQRDMLARSIDTMRVQNENLGSSLAMMCGYDAATVVLPAEIARVSNNDFRKMNFDDDLAETRKNSFSIWQRRITLRQAQNNYDKEIESTALTVQAAQQALEAEQENVYAAFLAAYDGVSAAHDALRAAQSAQKQAEQDLYAGAVQLERGMISHLAYQQAEDTAKNAELDVAVAELNLRSAYNTYEWAKKGVTAAPAA